MRKESPDKRTRAGFWKRMKELNDFITYDENHDTGLQLPPIGADISRRSRQPE
jgi:hypothetical protein